MPPVALLRTENYDPTLLDDRVERLFALCGFDKLFTPGVKVLIKPNLLAPRRPDASITTHPELVGAVARALKRQGVTDILLADSCGGLYTPATLKILYAATGMAEQAEREGFRLNFDTAARKVSYPDGQRCKLFDIITPILDADVVINVAKLKTHMMTGFSGAVKNMFGSVPGLLKPELHCRFGDKPAFGEMLTDLCQLVRPAVNFIDGVMAMEGNGPSGGTPRQARVLMASKDPFALDIAACSLIGLPVRQVPYLCAAIDRGLCPADAAALTLAGETPNSFGLHNFKKAKSNSGNFFEYTPRFMRGFLTKHMTPKPMIKAKSCIGCGKCAESCPEHTISMDALSLVDHNKKTSSHRTRATIHYDHCINCFCCHEMCPVKAVDIRRIRIFHFKSGA